MTIHRITNQDGSHHGWAFKCPGCYLDPVNAGIHVIHDTPRPPEMVNGVSHPLPVWTFNGNREKPTFSPSLLTHVFGLQDPRKCHLFIRDGLLDYCADSYHTMAGQQGVPIPADW